MKKLPTIEKKFIRNFVNMYPEYLDFVKHKTATTKSLSSLKRQIELLGDIIRTNNNENVLSLYDAYNSSNSVSEKILIKYGDIYHKKWKKKLCNRPRPKNFSILQTEYWIKRKGLSEAEAIQKVASIQSKNSNKATLESIKVRKVNNPITMNYWLSRGYNKEESELLREPYVNTCRNDLDSLIARHGQNKGLAAYKNRIEKYKKSMKENLQNRRTGGYVSKESLKFFIPLYKKCRKLGLERKDIYFGIEGSREFFIRESGKKNTGIFVDFCIPKLNLVLEYQGIFWHPRTLDEWKNPFIDFETGMEKENKRKLLIKNRGFDIIEIWSDDDLEFVLNETMDVIRKTINAQ